MAQQIVSPRTLIQGLIYTTILVCVGGFVLRLCGDGYREAKRADKVSMVLSKIIPFPEKGEFQFNFTHVLLFSALVAILSIFHHPAQDVIEQEAEKESKKAAKKEKKKEKEKGKEEKGKEAKK
mmetsp:Transcript_21252/g.38788  ORF Transcript_21252/g.38788 Transcript_21252/m.38788 type:complete len:123 (+) Transcript_21252:84-452(+)